MNPLGNGLTQSPVMQNLAQIIGFARSFSSPQAFRQELAKQNPQMAQYLNQLEQTIKNPEQQAIQMLQSQGINPAQLMSMLRTSQN